MVAGHTLTTKVTGFTISGNESITIGITSITGDTPKLAGSVQVQVTGITSTTIMLGLILVGSI